jgi:hypothetical protein
MWHALRSAWDWLGTTEPTVTASTGHTVVCPFCLSPGVTRIKAHGRTSIRFFHGRGQTPCVQTYFIRSRRDRILSAYTPEQRGETRDA